MEGEIPDAGTTVGFTQVSPVVAPKPEPTLADLQTTMNSFMEMMDGRMSRLEGAMYYVQQMVEQSAPMAQELRSVLQHVITNKSLSPDILSLQAPGPLLGQPTDIALEFEAFETKWFTERVFPDFKVRALQDGTPFTAADGWQIELSLIDANKNTINDRLGDPGSRSVVLRGGEATVSGLKFTAVSSKFGNHFNLQASVVSPEPYASTVPVALSPDFVILSCRLFHNPKRQIDELTPDDQLSKMPGIGRLYAERFASAQIHTIRQLAAIPLGPTGRRMRVELLNHLRRDKGTMTEPKLNEYIETALEIVKRAEVEALQPHAYPAIAAGEEPPPKRLRAESPPDAYMPPSNLASSVDQFFDFQQTSDADLLTPCIPNLMGTPQAFAEVPPMSDLQFAVAPDTATRSGSAPSHPHPTPTIADLPNLPNTGAHVAPPRGRVRPSIQYPLHNAIATGDLLLVRNVVKAMREGGLSLSEENNKGWTPLMFACATHQTPIIEFLCSLPDVHVAQQSTVSGATALHIAACCGDQQAIQILLRCPSCDAGAVNQSRYTPLMLAVVRGNTEATRVLSRIADSYRPKTVPGVGLYHLAALSGKLEIMTLVHEGCRTYSLANPSIHSPYGSLVWSEKDDRPEVPSILHCAAYAGSNEIISWLIEQGVKPTLVNSEGWTALHFAAFCGHARCVSLLASLVDVNSETTNGWTPLALAMMSRRGRSADTVSALLAAGAVDSGDIPANIVGVSTNNLQALEALHGCLKSPAVIKNMGEVSPMEVAGFFDTTKQLEHTQQRIEAQGTQSR